MIFVIALLLMLLQLFNVHAHFVADDVAQKLIVFLYTFVPFKRHNYFCSKFNEMLKLCSATGIVFMADF